MLAKAITPQNIMNNIAYIDGQNLYYTTKKNNNGKWVIDLARFRVFLKERYGVIKAYYHLGYVDNENEKFYDQIQEAGFILKFREHNSLMRTTKKGNVDTDVVFDIMQSLYKGDIPGKVILISGDGDYKKLVDFLIEVEKFEKILFPARASASSLYKKLTAKYCVALDDHNTMEKIGKKKGGP
ncbi:hypothetical protein A3C87_03600 [Candidatus Kaiserbacteria bacterium RIFCSPHIGHO2_02_FULL_49_34]|uniref:NYN domain-containing protein n=1 Tax=Candidatus Kaiserbacteria bacterium RIFCSPHIGHO2_02_FULL_49_34 TaxID=1798491 RepID=A0A1F6DIJ8_9BACT|nr:MAG: hypothetical protein A3C87_03600 [Candidatus Kaiserbacteria bacterium RIFCSPHIGHO2_02_FULL_49_34]